MYQVFTEVVSPCFGLLIVGLQIKTTLVENGKIFPLNNNMLAITQE